jgi:NAD(P)-dependent dehydrogenase (short-subunit alcohol dehydrogenase family)
MKGKTVVITGGTSGIGERNWRHVSRAKFVCLI